MEVEQQQLNGHEAQEVATVKLKDTGPTQHNLPREGFTVFVREETHAYHPANAKGLPGRRCAGASTVSKAFPDRPDGLMRWAETQTLEGVVEASLAGIELPAHGASIKQVLDDHELRYEQRRDKAAKRGTDVHKLILQTLALGQEIPDLSDLDDDDRGYGQAVFRWWKDRRPKPINVEQVILSKEHNYAGRFDLRAKFDLPMMSGVGLVDLKTAKRPYASDHIQLRLYDIAARECGIGESDFQMIVRVDPDGTYNEYMCAASEAHALLACQSYKARKEVDRAMGAA